jgi:hypothetical protein
MGDFHCIDRTEGVFPVSELDWDNTYYAAMLDDAPYAYLHLQTTQGSDRAMAHLTLLRFSRRVLREYRVDYAALTELLKQSGIKKIFWLKAYPVCQWEKLMHVLGFADPRDVQIDGKQYKMICVEVY